MIDDYLKAHKNFGVILDTNVFLLYLVGNYDKEFIKDFKRTVKYDEEDFDWLNLYVGYFSSLFVTPQILAEAWNLFEKISEPKFSAFLNSTLQIFKVVDEEYVHKDDVILNESFSYVGVTDTSIIEAAGNLNLLVITDDFRSFSYYANQGVSVINLNQLKSRYL